MADQFDQLEPNLASRLRQLDAACPISVVSGRRSHEQQVKLYNDWKSGRTNVPSVAVPGTSHHETGTAADISGDWNCIQSHLPRLGLGQPVDGERWHIELMGANQPNSATSTAPPADPLAHAEALFMNTLQSPSGDPVEQPTSVDAPTSAPTEAGAPTATSGGDWQASLSPAERWILTRESGLNPTAQNPHSTAFGIWQGLESTRKQYLGADWQTTDPTKQLDAFRRYVADRYGTADKAKAFWEEHGYY